MDQLQAGRIQVVALAGSPGPWATDLLRAVAALPDALRPAVVVPQAFETLAFLAEAGAAAEGVRVISRFVPSRAARRERAQLRRRLRRSPRAAAAGRDLRGGGCRRRARGREDRGLEAAPTRAALAKALLALPAHDGLLGRWAASPSGGITPRRLAVLTVEGGTFRAERVVTVAEPLPSSEEVK